MDIRDYTASDSHEITDLFHNSVHNINTKLYSSEQLEAWAPSPPDYEFWQQKLKTSKPYVAIIDGVIVGFIELEADGHIDCLYVHHRYQRQGVASALFSHASTVAINKGCRSISVAASSAAKPFFLKVGFNVVAENSVTKNGQTLINYSMCGQARP